jgi:threonine dehydrogenase-like Zn-dependent dehydrogenase
LTFQAAVTVGPGVTEIRTLELPPIGADGGLLQVQATGVCGSDWGYYQNLHATRGDFILGHESVGRVAAVGTLAARNWGVREGDYVALEEYLPCGFCKHCRSGDFRLCNATDWRLGGLRYGATGLSKAPGLWGGFSQFQYLHPNTVFHHVPDHVLPQHATLALPLSNGIEWTYLQGKAGPGQCVVIQGPGQQGLACVVAAREAGAAQIIVTGLSTPTDELRLAMARQLGAHHTISIQEEDALEAVADLTGGAMADLVIDCASGGPDSVVSAMHMARKKGRVVLAGQKRQPVPSFNSDLIISHFLTVLGMRGHSYAAVEMAIDLIAHNRHGVLALSSPSYGLHQTDHALQTLVGRGDVGRLHTSIDPNNLTSP